MHVELQFRERGAFSVRKTGLSDGFDRLVREIEEEVRKEPGREVILVMKAVLDSMWNSFLFVSGRNTRHAMLLTYHDQAFYDKVVTQNGFPPDGVRD